MAIDPGTKFGPYEIASLIGSGGMGEVYRAKDPRLGRDVALKTLPSGLAADPERIKRFELEARAASLISHPNILTVYDVGTSDGQPYIVSELLEGENLRERLNRGPLTAQKSSGIAAATADGLAAAHARGIVHRDLKPENLFLTRDGQVKILDFGVAKLTAPEPDQPGGASTRTILTDVGVAVGTLAYMSPEQIRGEPADPRSDIFALGTMLYEMIAGTPAFRSDSRIQTVNAVLEADPPELGEGVPPAIRRIIHRCLEKTTDRRFQSARDLAFALSSTSEAIAATPSLRDHTQGARTIDWRLALAAAALAAVTAAAAVWTLGPAPASPPRMLKRFVYQPATPIFPSILDLSRDGRWLAYSTQGPGGRLALKPFDHLEPRIVDGTDGAYGPFFSPDGEWVAFAAGGKLKKVSVRGGTPVTLCDAPNYLGGGWGDNGQIAVALRESGLKQVSSEGGPLAPLTTPDAGRGEIDHHEPHWLPGGKALLLTLHAGPEVFRVAVRSLESGEQRTLIDDGFSARCVDSGHIVFARGTTLFAAPFDLDRLVLTGPPVAVVENVYTIVDSAVAAFSVAADGTLVYMPDVVRTGRTLTWVDRAGTAEALRAPPREYGFPALSPDGQRVAVQISDGTAGNIFVYEPGSDLLRRVTLEGAESRPLWSRDGRHFTYAARRNEERHVFWQALDGSAAGESIVASRNDVWPGAWTPDGKLVFVESPPTEISDIKVARREGDGWRVEPLVAGPAEERWPSLAPDGRWIVYGAADRVSGRQIYVRPLSGGAPTQISTDGGVQPRWSANGSEVFYRRPGQMMRVPVQTSPALVVGKPERLFADVYQMDLDGPPNYDVTADGRHFLMIKAADEERAASPLHIVLDWVSDLEQRVPRPR